MAQHPVSHAPTQDDTARKVDARSKRQVSILIVDDEPGIRSFLQRALAKDYGLVEVADTADAAEQLRARCRFDVLIVDISLPGRSGLEWVATLRFAGERAEVIFMTAYADLNTTIGALRVGAVDFIPKPFRIEQLNAAIERALARRAPGDAAPEPTARREGSSAASLVGSSAVMQEMARIIQRVGPTPTSVLIEGETGTGKELVAAAIHRASRRRGSFIAVNCIAITPELFESELFGHTRGAFTGAHQSREGLFIAARGGTLFLDELSEMPPPMQAKLLRVLETRRIRRVGADDEVDVDVRLITATNTDLAEAVRAGRFREDLYFRLNVVRLQLPALREHSADIPELLAHFSETLSVELGVPAYEFAPDEIARLQGHRWPGNVRELRNFVERTLLLGCPPWDSLGAPPASVTAAAVAAAGFPADWPLDRVEKHHMLHVLGVTGGNKSEAARQLGISRKTLERKLSSWSDPTQSD
jgi:two-component system NtrC family response regulator